MRGTWIAAVVVASTWQACVCQPYRYACTDDRSCAAAERCVKGACLPLPFPDAGGDGGTEDASKPGPDGSPIDAGGPDAGAPDAEPGDAGAPDAGSADASADAGGQTDAGPACPADWLMCSGKCIDPTTDTANCGGCGKPCPAGQTCSVRTCVLPCPNGIAFDPPVTYGYPLPEPAELVIGDFDQDGWPDVAYTRSNAVGVVYNDGTGRLGNNVVIYDIGGGVFTTADFDGDGDSDLAVFGYLPPDYQKPVFQIFLSGPGRTLTEASSQPLSLPTSGSPAAALASDLDGDGNVDLVLLTFASIETFIGDGHGSFTHAGTTLLPTIGSMLTAGDMDANGHADLVLTQSFTRPSTVYPLPGDGSGGFTGLPTFATSVLPREVHLVDVDRDGKLDLIVGSNESHFSVSLGNGDGTFRPETVIATPWQAGILAIGDFDGDGKVDLVTNDNDGLRVLYGDGHGSFAENGPHPINGGTNEELWAVDMNGDGHLDVVGGGGYGSGINVSFAHCR